MGESVAPNEKAEKIIAAIYQAFGNVLRGGGVSLREGDALDSYANDELLKQARALDNDLHWWEIPAEQLEQFHTALSFMDAEGFRYYIPAYMTHALRTCEGGSLSIDAALVSLFPLHSSASDRYALLNHDQKKCIAQFLWFMTTETNDRWSNKLEVYNATRALEDFWYPYLENK